MDLPTWINAGAAVVSLVGAAFSWWRSNLSKQAREQARLDKEAAQAATIQADASQRQAETAKTAAEQSARQGVEQLQRLDEMTTSLNQIVQALRESGARPDVVGFPADAPSGRRFIERAGKTMLVIKNDSAAPFHVEHVRNRDQFARVELNDDFIIPPFGQKSFFALEAWGYPFPDHLVLDEVGSDEPTYLAIPR
ncbi:hypothetical protein [Trueperella abortisuis]|uniref:Uncharacterized protein n=1 Tax=Trueperella abortisuis TaxID=445930 RepID=A0ABT9PM47_9ACTO|nr:hypothetical protein [Trueperella abortisuis]MDP9833015.1 hypothetical protein [Trueperella abortisuis]